ncbi:Cytochrome P450 [Neofusicoccum parvum]|uniref:Cytochrome P450 n=1 Tax=Neofusicoccum parvum TaxID=310453 RepID=A0ACB5SB56_9PEZI|nr:Cytochrome P450 [Neofusicoccum parvum]
MNATSGAYSAPDAASSPQSFSALAAAGLGVATHIVSQNFVLDDHAWRLIGAFNLLAFSSIAASAYILGHGIFGAILHVVPLTAAALAGLYTSIAVRRLFLSPLRKFPGPWQARLTKFYSLWLESKNTQLFVEIQKLHEKHGDFVRTGPREISILRASAIPLLYGGKSPLKKATFYRQTEFEDEDQSLFNIISFQLHNKRRRIYDQGFSTKALTNYEPRVQSKVSTLLENFSKRAGQPLNVTEWMSFFAFDVMGDVVYSKDYNMMAKADGKIEADGRQATLQNLHDGMKFLGYGGTVPWILRMMVQAGIKNDFQIMQSWCRGPMRDKQANWKKGDTQTDASSYLLKAFEEGDPASRQTQQSLLQDSILLIIAGSDTTSSAAVNALYYLHTHPSDLHHLRALLDAAFPGGEQALTHDRLRAEVPFVDHVVNETMRLKPPACEGLLRETPPEGITVDGVYIPGGVNVSVPTWAVHRDGREWEEPEEWRPRRWEGVNLMREGLAFLPFSKGIFSCPGKTLAYMELRSLLARIVLRFDFEFAPGEDGVRFEKYPMDTFTMTNQPLQMVFKERSFKLLAT